MAASLIANESDQERLAGARTLWDQGFGGACQLTNQLTGIIKIIVPPYVWPFAPIRRRPTSLLMLTSTVTW
jgi:hypothetical protein